MASDDKTYCGRENYKEADEPAVIKDLVEKLGIAEQDVLDAIEQVGNDRTRVEAFFRSKENSY
jgi:hypothetical protein